MPLRQTLSSALTLQGSPLWPRDGCWLGLKPGDQIAEESRRARTMTIAKLAIFFNACLLVKCAFELLFNDSMRQGHMIAIPAMMVVHIITSISSMMVLCESSLAERRHILYIWLLLSLSVLPTLHTIWDPVNVHRFPYIMGRRCSTIIGAACCQLMFFGQISVRSLFLALPGNTLYLGKCCFCWSSSAEKYFVYGTNLVQIYVFTVVTLVSPLLLRAISPMDMARVYPEVQNCDDVTADFAPGVPPDTPGIEIHGHRQSSASSDEPSKTTSKNPSVSDQMTTARPVMFGNAGELEYQTLSPRMPLDVQVLLMSGDTVDIEGIEAAKLTVKQLKDKISERCGHLPEYFRLLVGTDVLEGNCSLSKLASPGNTLQISMVVESIDRGPFALGQEASWGVWENMSTNSEQLYCFDGTWQLVLDPSISPIWAVPLTAKEWIPLRTLHIEEGVVRLNGTADQINLEVQHGRVLLGGGSIELHGNELHRKGTTGRTHRYQRID